jgi:hypothetical protein
MDEFRSWEFLIQEQVKSGDMIRLPAVVKETVGVDHMLQGPSIFWSIENENRFIVLSQASLEKDAYTNVGIYEIYDIDSLDEDGARIRPPNDIGEVWAADPKPGERVFYLTHERMRQGQKPSVYLLSESQVLSLLPNRTTGRQQAITDSLFEVPGFGSSDR